MKTKLFIALLAVATALTACKKNEKKEVYYCCHIRDNFMSAVKADTTWRTDKLELSYNKDSLILLGINKNETLRLSMKVVDTGKYFINPKSGVYNILVGGDALVGEYRATTDTANYIKVLTYSKNTGWIEGQFKIKLTKSARYTNPALGNEVSFVRGKFSAALPK
ncbi:DUF6252 family protein [Mucilaginibacter roseus]|uniref:DUF6252 family protein n=1 Tax=Mucilaginibacter roseus TaxID=1528868 RepID=A0ABS8U5D3_9SPHI|nr:DUF6252 family protein [Mucilaginibacter roseus]MCD8742324.1 DUF6252 family protein [Mucilaginibacter roseus]